MVNKPLLTVPNNIAALLVAQRRDAGLTQEKLAEITRVHRQWIGRWERNRAMPSQDEWNRLA